MDPKNPTWSSHPKHRCAFCTCMQFELLLTKALQSEIEIVFTYSVKVWLFVWDTISIFISITFKFRVSAVFHKYIAHNYFDVEGYTQ